MRLLTFLASFIFLVSCTTQQPEAGDIVNKAIKASGGDVIANATISFKFRDYYYRATRNETGRSLERCTDLSCEEQHDKLVNGVFTRFRESAPITTPDSMINRYSNSVNSVHYFSVLPFGLNDPAVSKEYIDTKTVNGELYHRIKVSFAQEGGGDDFEDEYLYWIHTTKYTVDYLAYNYRTSEGGTRFREAYNERIVNGVRIADYRNFKPKEQFPPLTSLDSLLESKQLKLLSVIALEDVSVKACPEC